MTNKKPHLLLMLGFGLSLMGASSLWAGGSSRPQPNPFESGVGVNLDEWAKAKALSPLNVMVSSNVAAKLGPCGCSVNPKGGVDRRHNFIESNKSLSGTTMILDAGNALFASRNLDPSLSMQQRARAKKIAQAQKDLGVMAQNVGVLDLASGADFVLGLGKETGLQFISTNLVHESNESLLFTESLVKDVPGLGKVLVLGLSALPAGTLPKIKTLDPVTVVKQQIEKHKPKITLVLSDLGQSDDLSLMAKVGLPLVIVGARDLNALDMPMHASDGVLIQPGIQGQQLGVFRFAANGQFSAWRNLTQDKALALRWNQLTAEHKFVKSQNSSEDKTRSLARIKESFQELNKYANGDVEKSWPYAYELFDMDERYAQKNKFTKLALEDQ